MPNRLEYYRHRPAKRLWLTLTCYIFATTFFVTVGVLLVPATFVGAALELGLLSAGQTVWSCSMPLNAAMVAAIALALLLTHEASEMGCESRLLTDIFQTLKDDGCLGQESRMQRLLLAGAPYGGVLVGIPVTCLVAYVLVMLVP
jgi:hypothetical protein